MARSRATAASAASAIGIWWRVSTKRPSTSPRRSVEPNAIGGTADVASSMAIRSSTAAAPPATSSTRSPAAASAAMAAAVVVLPVPVAPATTVRPAARLDRTTSSWSPESTNTLSTGSSSPGPGEPPPLSAWSAVSVRPRAGAQWRAALDGAPGGSSSHSA